MWQGTRKDSAFESVLIERRLTKADVDIKPDPIIKSLAELLELLKV
jgi:hypothetical protein